jgi:hypothetical protein
MPPMAVKKLGSGMGGRMGPEVAPWHHLDYYFCSKVTPGGLTGGGDDSDSDDDSVTSEGSHVTINDTTITQTTTNNGPSATY